MKKEKNNKGYMLVEIILASVIALGIAYFIISLTMKAKSKNDDTFVETIVSTDKSVVTNKLMKYATAEQENFDCDKLSLDLDTRTLIYNGDIVNVFNKNVQLEEFNSKNDCSNDYGTIHINIPMKVAQMPDKDFDIEIDYQYLLSDVSYPQLIVDVPNGEKYAAMHNGTIYVMDNEGIAPSVDDEGNELDYIILRYAWGDEPVSCSDMKNEKTLLLYNIDADGVKIEKSDEELKKLSVNVTVYSEENGKKQSGEGKLYACNVTPISDVYDNTLPAESVKNAPANLDSDAPKCELVVSSGAIRFLSMTDDSSGIDEKSFGISKNANSPTFDTSTAPMRATPSTNYYGFVKDMAGNIGYCNIKTGASIPPATGGPSGDYSYGGGSLYKVVDAYGNTSYHQTLQGAMDAGRNAAHDSYAAIYKDGVKIASKDYNSGTYKDPNTGENISASAGGVETRPGYPGFTGTTVGYTGPTLGGPMAGGCMCSYCGC